MKPDIKPVGIGDLMVVKQVLVRYEPGEVAHIENVMASESRGREHRRLRRTEETFVIEQEHTEESQRDLQSTERFELKHEVEKTIKQETKFEVGAELSGTFGPVKIGINTSFSTSTSKSESDKKAMEYAKEITEKSISKVVDRVRQERTTKTIEEFEEKNFHKFENAEGGNKSGVYRWVDKFYRVKVVNYGKRLFYEFLVPEPAAFYIFARTYNINTNLLPVEPEPPVLGPSGVNATNYLRMVRRHGAMGVTPPPPQKIILTRYIAREMQSATTFSFVDSELEIPPGYVRVDTDLGSAVNTSADDWKLTVQTPGASQDKDPNGGGSGGSNEEVSGLYPMGALGRGLDALLVTVMVTCERTDEAMNEWRLKTYQAIMDAFNKKKLAYEEQLAAAQIQGGIQIGGNNPMINRVVERDELKKSCITLWTGHFYDHAPGIGQSLPEDGQPVQPKHFPKINRVNAAALRPEIKFLEQAFDWANLSYEFYPYYWGRRSQWLSKFDLSDKDPLFEEFLKAGAARVLVPVHPAATAQVLFYQLTGKLWPGGEIPQLDPPDPAGDLVAPGVADQTDEELALYQDYMAELLADNPGDDLDKEIDISPDDPDSWMVKVPTSLVWLQPDAVLPDFDTQGPDNG